MTASDEQRGAAPGDGRLHRLDVLAPALLLLGPVFHLLRAHGYPLLRDEVLLLVALVAMLGLAIGVAARGVRVGLRVTMLALLVAVVVDLYVPDTSLTLEGIALAVALLLGAVLRERFGRFLLTVAVPVLATTLLPPRDGSRVVRVEGAGAVANPALPPVFHIILDEHAGIAAFAPDTAFIRDATTWYGERGFRLYPHAYSPYHETYNSLPNVVNLTTSPVDRFHLGSPDENHMRVLTNRYFAELRRLGYRMRVYQSDYLDFCRSEGTRPTSCHTYPANSLAYATDVRLPTLAHAMVLLHYVLSARSDIYVDWRKDYHQQIRPALASLGVPAPAWEWGGANFWPSIDDLLRDVEADARRGADGTVFFAHVLAPHQPYQFGADCGPLEQLDDWLDSADPNVATPDQNTPASRERRWQLYRGQVRCVMQRLEAFFARLDSAGVYDRAVIVMHGDHGSRIWLRRPATAAATGQFTRRDFLDAYAALLAVKSPGMAAGPDTTTLRISDALSALVRSNFHSIDQPAAASSGHSVFVRLGSGQPMQAIPIDSMGVIGAR